MCPSNRIQDLAGPQYRYGFVTDIEADTLPRGLNEDVIRMISAKKNEPEFMLEWRLKAYRQWLTMKEPKWAKVQHPPIDYQNVIYYSAPKTRIRPTSLDEVDPVLLATYRKLGIPLREQEMLTGVAVGETPARSATAFLKLRERGAMTAQARTGHHGNEKIPLPPPKYDSRISIEQSLLRRRSVREYKDQPLTLLHISQLLWAAQGTTDPAGYRTAPSAGALYPLELYVLVGNVSGLEVGIYRYSHKEHTLRRTGLGDKRLELRDAALGQPPVARAMAVVILCAIYERTTVKYGTRGKTYVHMEAGHAAQNVYLQAVSLGLGTVVIGAFQDDRVKKVLGLSAHEEPLYLMPIGSM